MTVGPNRRRLRARRGAFVAVAVVLLGLTAAAAGGSAARLRAPATRTERHAAGGCRAPRLSGLTLRQARGRATRAGCALQTKDVQAPGPQPQQRIVRQLPAAGQSARAISVWLAPRCPKPGPTAPLAHEPSATAGPTELISGIFLVGGPVTLPWMCPRVPQPLAGSIVVTSPVSGATVAVATVVAGQLATIALEPGTYSVAGTDPQATTNSVALRTRPETVRITAGTTLRQDVFIDVP